jgi:hypothetical protein
MTITQNTVIRHFMIKKHKNLLIKYIKLKYEL